ncbi:MAG: serine/threonine-protein kinase [Pseudomonadota bacterium]
MDKKTDAISTERWARIQSVFDAAMDLSPGERTAYVATECEGDDALRNQIEALMLAANTDEDVVGDLLQSAAFSLFDDSSRLGTTIGPFKLIRAIGEGGMGVVFLAQRDDHEFVQDVAIKVLHKGIVSEDTQQRFLAERQILADLNHPNIARLLDGGQTEDGLPYIVMEHIDGEPLVDYCNHHNLPLRARLALFQQVCSAVAEAHRSLIVHRDIKSNNILVGSDGTPKLLDFGIAKVLRNQLGELDLAKTHFHDRLLTPDSASPEQITGETITTATDIYSLGILLYELLAGCRPFRLADSTVGEMERTICHELPMPPSEALGQILDESKAEWAVVASRRGTTPNRLAARLRGELDSIVLMAIKKEPRRRYLSAKDFSDDISRYLDGEPVKAIRDSRGYRAMKFISRNRLAVSVATAFVTAISAFAVTNYIQSKEIAAQAVDLAAQARDMAIQNQNMEDTLGFLGNVFIAASPEGLQKREPSALDILNFAEQKTADELSGRPAIIGRLLQTIGSGYLGQEQNTKALELYEESLNLITASYGPDHPVTAGILHDLGRYHWTRNWDVAADYYVRALAILEREESIEQFGVAPEHQRFALQRLLRDMAELEIARGLWDKSQSYIDEALAISRQLTPSTRTSTEIGHNLIILGAVHLRRGNLDRSDRYYALALAEFKGTYGPTHTLVAEALNEMALSKHAQGKLEEAEGLYKEVVSTLASVFDENDSRLLPAKADLGRFLSAQGKHQQAQQLLIDVTEGLRQRGDSYELAFNLVQLAVATTRLAQYDRAERMLDEALSIYADTIEPAHLFIGEAFRQYGNLRLQQERYRDAVVYFDDALAILLPQLGENHWQTAVTMSEKAEALIHLNERDQAHVLLQTAAPLLASLLGEGHRLSQEAQARLLRLAP